ncbi:uroporphyrinogen-III synthase [Croceicoccus sediminis]|uniref:uroporphyrinogen-III synthase n=1 Tax=Croceicoccus sediminis TaxID=2571150 RepID=UPI0011823C2D|nr:uroporphyrinogen-III synthase [Croceicoccus sediminis]
MKTVITIRPAPGDARTVALGEKMGIAVESHPLFAVEPVAWDCPDAADYDAILIGSANVLRHGGECMAGLTDLPAWCVGEASAAAARKAGFSVAGIGSGGLQSVIPMTEAAGHCRLLRVSGEAHVPLDLPEGMSADTRTAYRVANCSIGAGLAEKLRGPCLVLLHSAEAAAHFAGEVDRLDLARGDIALACLAPRIADSAGSGWLCLSTAPSTDDGALLALAMQMCQA